jgi:hypothetical protein
MGQMGQEPMESPTELPVELLLEILAFLNVADLFRVERVCRRWRETLVPKTMFQRIKRSSSDLILRFDSPSSQPLSVGWNFLRLWPSTATEVQEEVDEEAFDSFGHPVPRRTRNVVVFEFQPWKSAKPGQIDGDLANERPPRTSLPSWLVPQSLFVPPTPMPIDQPLGYRQSGKMLLPVTAGSAGSQRTPMKLAFSGWEKDIGLPIPSGRVPSPPGQNFSLAAERLFMLPAASTDKGKHAFGDVDVRIEFQDLPWSIDSGPSFRTVQISSIKVTLSFLALGYSSRFLGSRTNQSSETIWKNRICLPRELNPGPDTRLYGLIKSLEAQGLGGWNAFKFEFGRRHICEGTLPAGSKGANDFDTLACLIVSAERSEAHRRGDYAYLDRLDEFAALKGNADESWLGGMLRWIGGFL